MSWKVIKKTPNTDSLIAKTLTLGLSATEYDYKVENRKTHEVRTVPAYDDRDLTSKIEKGKFSRNK
jgi:hypothetical protein